MKRWPIITPTSSCVGLVLLGLAICYAGFSQSNNGAFILGFTIAAMVLFSAARTWTNLWAVAGQVDPARPVFAGQEIVLPFELSNLGRKPVFGLAVRPRVAKKAGICWVAVIGQGNSARGEVGYPALRRGVHPAVPIEIHSRFPLGFFNARLRVESGQRVIVYPAPAGDPNLPLSDERQLGNRMETRAQAGDDFAGVRPYVVGESQRHVDWKAAARGAPLLIKHFAGEAGERMMFDFDQLVRLDAEARLSQLALWVLRAERAGHFYGLRLPQQEVEIGKGEAHLARCLSALAEVPGGNER